MLSLLREISLRHLVHSPLRTLLVLFGIGLGVAMLVATTAVNRSLVGAFTETVGRVAGKADLVVTNGDVGVPSELVETILDTKGVAHAAGTLEVITRQPGGDGPLLVLGVDFLGDRYFLPFKSTAGQDAVEDPLELINDPVGILVSRKLAERQKLELGGSLELVTGEGTKAFRIRGILEDEGPTAAFGGQVAVMYTEALMLSFGRGERVDRIEIAVAPEHTAAEMQVVLQKVVGGRGRVEGPEGRAQHLAGILGPLEAGIQVAGLIALMVGMFLIYNAVSVAVAQRRREIGILRAIGVSQGRVVLTFCLEAGILGLVGGLFGLLLAHGLAQLALDQTTGNVSQFYAPIQPTPPKITLDLGIYGVLSGMIATLVAAYLPARAAAHVDPVETLRRARSSATARRRLPHRKMLFAGLLCLLPAFATAWLGAEVLVLGFVSLGLFVVAATLFVPSFVLIFRRAMGGIFEAWLGVPGRLAVDNVERSMERSVLTVAALMVSVASGVCIASWGRSLEMSMMDWVEQSVPADVLITAGSPLADQHNVPFRPEMMERLADIPGVDVVQPARIINQEVGPLRLQLLSLNTDRYLAQQERRKRKLKYTEGEVQRGELYAEPRIMLSENGARRLGKHPGDTLEIDTPTGRQKFEVRAIFVDYTSDQGLGFIDRRWFQEYWQDDLVDSMDLYLKDGVDVDQVVAEVKRRFGDDRALFITPASKLREEIRRVVTQSLAILKSTDFITLAVALLGVVGTMLAAVIDRIREIGVLRAVGATQRQVAVSVVAEAGFLGLASALTGLFLGVPMGLVFVRTVALASTGWHVDYSFPAAAAARVAITVVVTAALAGLLPGRRAARMDVTEALSYE